MRNAPGVKKVVRPKGFEKHVVDIGVRRLANETAAQRNHREAQEVLRAAEEAYEVQRKEKLAMKDESAAERLAEGQKAWSGKKGVTFEGMDRIMPIGFNTPGYLWAVKRTSATTRDLRLMLNRPDAFPNPRLVYSYLNNNYRIVWDGMDVSEE